MQLIYITSIKPYTSHSLPLLLICTENILSPTGSRFVRQTISISLDVCILQRVEPISTSMSSEDVPNPVKNNHDPKVLIPLEYR